MAHLGIGERDAWAMTMTSLVAALRAKFPQPKSASPTVEEHDATMAWFERVQAMRGEKTKNGAD